MKRTSRFLIQLFKCTFISILFSSVLSTTNAAASTSSTIIPILPLLLSGCDGPKETTSYAGIPSVTGVEQTPFITQLTPTATLNEYLIANAWGDHLVADLLASPGLIGQFAYSGTLIISDDCSVTIIGDDSFATGGTGAYNPVTGSFTYSLSQTIFAIPYIIDVVLTPL